MSKVVQYLYCHNSFGDSKDYMKCYPFYSYLATNDFILVDKDYDSEPDYVIFDCYGPAPPATRWIQKNADGSYHIEIPEIETNAVKIFCSGENVQIDMSRCDWAIGSALEEDINHPNYQRRGPYPSVSRKRWRECAPEDTDWMKVVKAKSKFCSFVYSNSVSYREMFCRRMIERNRFRARPIDCLGYSLCNGERMPKGNDGWQDLEQLSKYKFSIAFENTEGRGYTTEKLIEPMLANTIPIYWGNPAVAKDFNTESFICVYDFDTLEDVIDYVVELDDNDEAYAEKLSKRWLAEDSKWFQTQYRNAEVIFG